MGAGQRPQGAPEAGAGAPPVAGAGAPPVAGAGGLPGSTPWCPPQELSPGLERLLRRLGASSDQIRLAGMSGRPSAVAADLVLSRGAELDAATAALRVGVDTAELRRMWRLLGVQVPEDDRPFFTDDDVELSRVLLFFCGEGPVSGELLRLLGASVARLAEAAVALYVQTMEPAPGDADTELAWAESIAETVDRAVAMGDHLGPLLVHHLREAVDLQRRAQTSVQERALSRVAVGFVDLVGSTALARSFSPAQLVEMVGRFETLAFEVVSGLGGRVVKHIGDEIMFVALEPVSACRIALGLVDAFKGAGVEPRGGLAFGDVVSRYGDYYGPVVNLAARLADLAIPCEVLVDQQVVTAAGSAFSFEQSGRRLLKGFPEPVLVSAITGEREEGAGSTGTARGSGWAPGGDRES